MRKLVGFLIVFLLAAALPRPVSAAGSYLSAALSKAELRPGEEVELSVGLQGVHPELGAFFLFVEYDSTRLTCLRSGSPAAVSRQYTRTTVEDGRITDVFAVKFPLESSPAEGIFFTHRFRVSEAASQGDLVFRVTMKDAADRNALPVECPAEVSLSCRLLPPLRTDAELLSLTPAVGALEPDFSPERHEYRLTVPYETASLTFLAEPVEGAVCRVNRKNLGSGGSDTLFRVTVTAEDGVTKAEYSITVHREKKAASPSPSPTPTPTPKPSRAPTVQPSPKPTAKPSAAPSKTPTPTASAAPSVSPSAVPALTEEPSASPTPSPSPMAQPVKEETPGPPVRQEPVKAVPTVTIQNGQSSMLPAFLALAFLIVILYFSRPLARALAGLLTKRRKG